jgi:hypothetical protein
LLPNPGIRRPGGEIFIFYESLLTYTQHKPQLVSRLSRRVIVKLRREDNLKIIALNEMMNTHNFC